MGTKQHKPEEIVTKLWQVEVRAGQGMAQADTVQEVRITEQTYCRRRKQNGGMGTDQLRELKRSQKKSSCVEPSRN
jgi:putative transposase